MFECLKHLPELDNCCEIQDSLLNLPLAEDNHLDLAWARDTQEGDAQLMGLPIVQGSKHFFGQFNDDIELVCCTKEGNSRETNWKTALANMVLDPSICWFHQMLNHLGRD